MVSDHGQNDDDVMMTIVGPWMDVACFCKACAANCCCTPPSTMPSRPGKPSRIACHLQGLHLSGVASARLISFSFVLPPDTTSGPCSLRMELGRYKSLPSPTSVIFPVQECGSGCVDLFVEPAGIHSAELENVFGSKI